MRKFRLILSLLLTAAVAFGLWFWLPFSPRMIFSANDRVTYLCFSPDNQCLAIGHHDLGPDGEYVLSVWEMSNGEVKTIYKEGEYHVTFAFSPDGKNIAVGRDGGEIQVWDRKNGNKVAEFNPGPWKNSTFRLHIVYSTKDRLLVLGSESGSSKVWDVETGREEYVLFGENEWHSKVYGRDDWVASIC